MKRIRHEAFTGKVADEAALYGMKGDKLPESKKPWKPRKVRSIAVSNRLMYQGLDDKGRPIWA